jgi:hypothetical protein
MPIAGILIASHGWESVFYVFGAAGVGFVFFWMLLVYDSPNNHPYITDAEKSLLQTSLADEMAQNRKVIINTFLIFGILKKKKKTSLNEMRTHFL